MFKFLSLILSLLFLSGCTELLALGSSASSVYAASLQICQPRTLVYVDEQDIGAFKFYNNLYGRSEEALQFMAPLDTEIRRRSTRRLSCRNLYRIEFEQFSSLKLEALSHLSNRNETAARVEFFSSQIGDYCSSVGPYENAEIINTSVNPIAATFRCYS